MEEFCNLVTGLALLGDDPSGELRLRVEAAQNRCDQVRAALFDAQGTPSEGVTVRAFASSTKEKHLAAHPQTFVP